MLGFLRFFHTMHLLVWLLNCQASQSIKPIWKHTVESNQRFLLAFCFPIWNSDTLLGDILHSRKGSRDAAQPTERAKAIKRFP